MQPRLVRIAQIASTPDKRGLLPVSRATIWRWVQADRFPKPFKLSRAVTVWLLDDVEAFVAQQLHTQSQFRAPRVSAD